MQTRFHLAELGSSRSHGGAPAACAAQASPWLSSWFMSSHALCRIPAYQKLAQGILPACSDETGRCFKRIHIFFKSWLIAESDCRKELTQSDVVSTNTTSIMLFFHMQLDRFNSFKEKYKQTVPVAHRGFKIQVRTLKIVLFHVRIWP